MKNIWIRFGCFLTGYNYNIVINSSEMAAKSVKKFTAAIMIVCILWFFIGFTFAQRYLQLHIAASVVGGLLSIIVIVQIERQIILTIRPSPWLYFARSCLAVMMAILGAVIIDQIIFQKDITLEKVAYISERVDEILPSKTRELKDQIAALDTTINGKEAERQRYIEDITKNPMTLIATSSTESIPMQTKLKSTTGEDSIVVRASTIRKTSTIPVPNPKSSLIAPIDSVIADMRRQKADRENDLLNIRKALEIEMRRQIGFLDELKVMYRLLSGSGVALFFWLLWIFFFLFIELLVLAGKIGDKSDDYEKTVLHHMNLQIRRLDALASKS
jgi:hypothetical protein